MRCFQLQSRLVRRSAVLNAGRVATETRVGLVASSRRQRYTPSAAFQDQKEAATKAAVKAAEGILQGTQNTVDDTLSALDSILDPPQPRVEPTAIADPIVNTAIPTPTANPTQASTSGREDRDYQALAKAAVKLAIDAAKDYLKPTSIIDKDANLPRANPLFSYLLLALNILVYATGLGFRFLEGEDGPTDYFLALANVNDGIEAGEYYRIITSNFLHDSVVHLGLSSYALLTIAPEAEAVLGNFTFLTTYLLGGAAGSILCFLLSDTLTVGASSGIFGLLGALGAYLYKNHKVPQSSEQSVTAICLLAFNLFLGGNKESAIDNLGHLGGLLAGIYLGMLLTPAVIDGQLPGAADARFVARKSGEVPKLAAEEVSTGDEEVDRPVEVIQPSLWQSIVVLLCVTITLSSSVAAAVLHRTGELPIPRGLPF